jgi:hypothetical protein
MYGRRKERNSHIERMTGNRVVKIARDKLPNGRRSTGRPRKRWCEDILIRGKNRRRNRQFAY